MQRYSFRIYIFFSLNSDNEFQFDSRFFCFVFFSQFSECIFKGERYESGAEWSDPDDPCASFKCVAGVVTESNMQCYTPCNNPLLPRPGQCCSTCLGKFFKQNQHCTKSLQFFFFQFIGSEHKTPIAKTEKKILI